MNVVFDRLGDLSVDRFMQEYWQKKPLLIRNLFGEWTAPLSPEELLNLATREDADSRLILTGSDPVELYHGPFEDGELKDLPATEWTVLVQETDRLLPAVADLLGRFRFLPNWRLDDVMISYAAPGGGVGAHTDQYDVFLIQGSGRRRWEIETRPRSNPVWRDDSEVAMLAEFEPDAVWELEPGDVLYLPPMIPHNGIALEPCMTISVGCRAPGTGELLAGVLGYAAEDWADEDRYSDPDAVATPDPGLLSADARAVLRDRVRRAVADDDLLDRWLGRYVTEPSRGHSGLPPKRWISLNGLRRRLDAGATLRPAVVSQTAYTEQADGAVTLFVSGQAYPMPVGSAVAARLLTGARPLDAATLEPLLAESALTELLVTLVNAGALVVRER